MLSILFVDDEKRVLAAVRRLLHLYRNRWEMDFVTDSREAAKRISKKHYDLVLSDLQMPGLNGIELLKIVKAKSPASARVILTGDTDTKSVTQISQVAHRLLAKPCNPNEFKDIVMRLCILQESLPELSVRKRLLEQNSLPSQPSIFLELQETIDSKQTSTKAIAGVISKDMALAAKVIQLANSSYYGTNRKITELDIAVGLLGIDIVVSLALSFGTFNQFSGRIDKAQLDALSEHSLLIAQMAAEMATVLPVEDDVAREAFLAGLLHDCGKLFLAEDNSEIEYQIVRELSEQFRTPLWQTEENVWGMTHAKIGGLILDLWGLPLSLAEAVTFHHEPSKSSSPANNAAALIHVADLIYYLKRDKNILNFDSQLDHELVASLGWTSHIENWKQMVLGNTNEVKS